jgi:hypothetical protein
VRVEQFDVGAFSSPAGLWRAGEDNERWDRFPVPPYLVEVGDERILVDAGLHPAAIADPVAHYAGADNLAFLRFEQQASVAERVDLPTLTRAVITRAHGPQCSALNQARRWPS